MGAIDHGMEEWMLCNVQRSRAQYQQTMHDQAQSEKDRAEKGRNSQTGETPDDRMDEEISVMHEKNPLRGTPQSC